MIREWLGSNRRYTYMTEMLLEYLTCTDDGDLSGLIKEPDTGGPISKRPVDF